VLPGSPCAGTPAGRIAGTNGHDPEESDPMTTASVPAQAPSSRRGWTVAAAGVGINLALGVLYTWSLFKGAIEKEFGWQGDRLNDPYALCCLTFAVAMIVAGRCQDRFGPRITATVGGVLVGAGMLLVSDTTSYGVWLLGFGVLAGAGIGFGYSAATPPALKWFPPSKTGLVAGLVVAGFGLAPVYLAPLSQHLLGTYGVGRSMGILGVAFAVVVCVLARGLVNPPATGAAAVSVSAPAQTAPAARPGAGGARHILGQPMFWLLWTLYFIGAGAGLMVIGSVSGMAKKSMGELAFVAVAILAIGNAGGRVAAGTLSDRIGRRRTLLLVLLVQAALMLAAIPLTGAEHGSAAAIVLLAALIGANYGANLSLFPSYAKDLWGLQSFGLNYGMLFTAWGAGGLVLPRLQQTLTARSDGSYASSFVTASCMLVAGGLLSLLLPRRPVASPAAT